MIKFVSNFRQVGGLLRLLQVPSTNNTDRHDITEILLKVALNTINQPRRIGNINMKITYFCIYGINVHSANK